MKKNIVFWSGILGVVFFVLTVLIGVSLLKGYSHISQYISESYTIDTTYGFQLRAFGYFPSGLLLTIFGLLAMKSVPKAGTARLGFLGLALFYGLTTVATAIFPCDAGCNRELKYPSLSQLLHNLSGFLTYIFIPFSLLMIGIGARSWHNAKSMSTIAIIAGIIGIFINMLLFSDANSPYVGLFQRIMELSILSTVVVSSFYFKNNHPTKK